jgi:tRNA modification GTPase
MYHKDTIAAIATPAGSGGIGIILINGPAARDIVSHFFRPAKAAPAGARSHQLCCGILFDPRDGSDLDEALVAYMQGPHSYTGEDVVEINCHSGLVLLDTILHLSFSRGARLAEPGEFTRRAFLNGRMDLTRAEAVIDVIEAKSELALKLASRQLTGKLEQRLTLLHSSLVEITAEIEAAIDFPEDDILLDAGGLCAQVQSIADAAEAVMNTFHDGCLYKNGVQAVITGKPNVGKSSLLNALLGEERALVASVPGTTRDIIEDSLTLSGIQVRLSDTAGLHRSDHEIERMGIERAREKIHQADIVLLVLDASRPLEQSDHEIAELLAGTNHLAVINKTDLPAVWAKKDLAAFLHADRTAAVSALGHHGIEELKETLAQMIGQQTAISPSDILIANARHRCSLEKTRDALKAAFAGLTDGLAPELIAVDLHTALDSLGEITGATTPDDILETIFSRFCIGK